MKQEQFEDIQSGAYEIEEMPATIGRHIQNAHCCETPEDLIASLKEAVAETEDLLKELRSLLRRAKP